MWGVGERYNEETARGIFFDVASKSGAVDDKSKNWKVGMFWRCECAG